LEFHAINSKCRYYCVISDVNTEKLLNKEGMNNANCDDAMY